ncbi:MAG: ribosome biogenesis GTPase Der [Rhodospirillaceae bacterium]|jgi:GTP-binding protein|nr:ribosome biogenesis GTPase Der [Rhodospirillaceae bacterium]
MKPVIAIVGRPNVGKSTLFNRLIGRRSALVDPTPGVTRDRREGDAMLGKLRFTAVDTAGLEEAPESQVESEMQLQTQRAIEDADAALLVFDARAGVTPLDRHFADMMRKSRSPVILVANKCEARSADAGRLEAYELGLGDPVAIASEHGIGMPDLEDAILAALEGFEWDKEDLDPKARYAAEDRIAAELDDESDEEEEEVYHGPLQLAIVGRPNVGKSTLVNKLLGDERVITGPEAGITRDAISIEWTWQGTPIKLIDTAGMRRKARIDKKVEKLSVGDTLEAIRFAHVVVLVVDATMMPEKQDLVIARHIIDEGRAIVIAVNKWDVVEDGPAALKLMFDRMEISLPQIRGVPVVTLSALTSRGIHKLLPEVLAVYEVWNRRVPTGPLNRWLGYAVERHPPPIFHGRRLRIRYMTQSKSRPPTFVVFTSQPKGMPESYIRYLTNGIREEFDFPGVPIRINLRGQKNPYAPGGDGT